MRAPRRPLPTRRPSASCWRATSPLVWTSAAWMCGATLTSSAPTSPRVSGDAWCNPHLFRNNKSTGGWGRVVQPSPLPHHQVHGWVGTCGATLTSSAPFSPRVSGWVGGKVGGWVRVRARVRVGRQRGRAQPPHVGWPAPTSLSPL